MRSGTQSVIIVGGGVAGLCAAVYARNSGYDVHLLEMSESLGGLATSWHRGDYTFETCLHWLLGSNPQGELHSTWQEVFDIDSLTFVNSEEFERLETEHGEFLSIFRNVDRLEQTLLERSPEDADEIRHLTSTIRKLSNLDVPQFAKERRGEWLSYLHDVPYLPLLYQLSGISSRDYGKRFRHPLLKFFFGEGEVAEMSVMALMLSLVWMNKVNAGYPIGGSQAVVRGISDRLVALGGHIRCGAKVEQILVEKDNAIGVQLAGGEKLLSDWVISAADGHATIFDLLGGRYVDEHVRTTYEELVPFPSYLQVSLGVALDLSQQPGLLSLLLDTPIQVDSQTTIQHLQFRIFNYDPTFAPAGKTAVTCFIPTRNFQFWERLQADDPEAYRREKQRVADSVVAVLSRKIPQVPAHIEVVDVATPATVIRYTGNWQGSMEGWLMMPGRMFGPLPNTLPGLGHFLMAGQWVVPGGGLPSCVLSARSAVREICRHDGRRLETASKT